jgi:predicted DNA-binding transcriptional regulator AlpA
MTRFMTRFERPRVPVNAHGPGWFKVVAGLLRGMSAEPEERLDRTPMWTLDELCAFLRTTPATVHTWRKHGRAPKAYKIGRHLLFAEADVRAWLKARAEAAEGPYDTTDDPGMGTDGSGW